MALESYQTYGRALRVAASVRLAEYDRQTIAAFLADLFRKDYEDVERDLAIISKQRSAV